MYEVAKKYSHRKIAFDTEWLTVNPTSGDLVQGDSQNIELDFDTSNLSPGTYYSAVLIGSNDPDEEEVVIPVTLTVFSEETSYMYVDNQQISRGADESIPLKVHVSSADEIAGIVYAISITPEPGVENITLGCLL